MKIRNLLVGMVLSIALFMQGCSTSTSTLGNGTVDPVEAAVIQVAVGVAMAAKPETIVPAFAVTSALLAVKDSNTTDIVALSGLDELLAAETAKLDLDPLTLQSFNDLINLVKVTVAQKLDLTGLEESSKLIIAWQVVDIVNATANARLTKAMVQ